MIKKIKSTILSLLILSFVIFCILFVFGYFQKQKAGILIESDPKSKVFINGQQIGSTPYDGLMNPDYISLKIIPEPINNIRFDDYETKIKLVSGVKTIVKRSFNQNEDMSSLVIVSFEKISRNKSEAVIITNPDNSQVFVDQRPYGYTPLSIDLGEGEHNLIVSANEYNEKSLPIKIYKGYKLTAFIKLAKAKNNQNDLNERIENKEETFLFKVKIKENGPDFVDIRSGANSGFPIVGQIKKGEIYDVFETGENETWYKIKTGEIDGWINGEFIIKINQIPTIETPE